MLAPTNTSTRSQLFKKTRVELQGLVADVPYSERDEREWCERIRASSYARYSTADLKRVMKRLHLPLSGWSKVHMIDALHRFAGYVPCVDLDPDQARAIARSREVQRLIVYGNPGSGKTTTLAQIVLGRVVAGGESTGAAGAAGAAEPPSLAASRARVLCLSFDRNSEKVLKARIKSLDDRVRLRAPKDAVDAGCAGIYVMTFDKYAARRNEGAGPQSYDGSTSYETAFRRGLERGVQPWESWTDVFIDEMQDVNDAHMELVRQVLPANPAARVVFAGDPRQELYDDTGYMTEYWRESSERGFERCALRYNHRSDPAIVALLNDFSRRHFGDLHVDQIPARQRGTDARAITASAAASLVDEASIVARFLVGGEGEGEGGGGEGEGEGEADASRSFAISPVSVERYHGTETIVKGVRQAVSDLTRGANHVAILGRGAAMGEDVRHMIGTARAVKGGEASRVALIQGDVPYERLGVSADKVRRLLFVSLSRARDRLHISLAAKGLRAEGFLACVARHAEVRLCRTAGARARRSPLPTTLRVLDDLARRGHFEVRRNDHALVQVPPLGTRCPEAPDFLGVVVESHCAKAMGIEAPDGYDVHTSDRPCEWRVHIEARDDHSLRGCIVCPSHMATVVRRILAAETDKERRFAKLAWSLEIQREWTLGDGIDLREVARGVVPCAREVGRAVCRSRLIREDLLAHRSGGVKLGELVGITDIETDDDVVEIKHVRTDEALATGRRQLAAYASLLGKGGLLYSSVDGTLSRIRPPEARWTRDFARAALGLKQARYRRSHLKSRRSLAEWADLLIVVDTETSTCDENRGELLEVGAVALLRRAGAVVDVFHEVSPGVESVEGPRASTSPLDPEYYGFTRESACRATRAGGAQLREQLARWADRLLARHGGGRCDVVQYGGNDCRSVGLEGRGRCWDARHLFRVWLESVHAPRTSDTKLTDAVEQLVGERGVFVPHRAFEDAVATMMLVVMLQA
jgi:hypothetical protein